MIKYAHLVANMIILHNVNNMIKVLNNLDRSGFELTPELLAVFSSYRHEHINKP